MSSESSHIQNDKFMKCELRVTSWGLKFARRKFEKFYRQNEENIPCILLAE